MKINGQSITKLPLAMLAVSVLVSGCLKVEGVANADLSGFIPDVETGDTGDTGDTGQAGGSGGSVSYSSAILNDTGVVDCADDGETYPQNADLHCATYGVTKTNDGVETANGLGLIPRGQDALYGRDATHYDDVDGIGGFSFTKLDINGAELPAASSTWACVRDNVTSLVWEVKTNDNGLRDKDHTYTWYNSTGINDGGNPGSDDSANTGGNNCDASTRCDTEKYVEDVNGTGLCGISDWRLPTPEEALNLMALGNTPMIDMNYFKYAEAEEYWTELTSAYDSRNAKTMSLRIDKISEVPKSTPSRVRLVASSN